MTALNMATVGCSPTRRRAKSCEAKRSKRFHTRWQNESEQSCDVNAPCSDVTGARSDVLTVRGECRGRHVDVDAQRYPVIVEPKNVCDRLFEDCNLAISLALAVSCKLFLCLYYVTCARVRKSIVDKALLLTVSLTVLSAGGAHAWANELDKTEQLLDKINLEQSIAAVFNKVAYGSTTKRSIPDNAYPVTTMSTMLLTTFR